MQKKVTNEEVGQIIGKVAEKGYSLIPLEVYFEGSLCKLKIGLCKGKHVYDKKASLKERDIKRSMEREIRNY